MPTSPAILDEIASRYGGCDASDPDEVARFYGRTFWKLSRRKRDRISFEILMRDGEPKAALSQPEIAHLDQAFERDEDSERAIRPPSGPFASSVKQQAALSVFLFLALGLLLYLPRAFPGLRHHLDVVEATLAAIGAVSNVAWLLERRSMDHRDARRSGE